ncbi:GNAT family N-acetyltransferase [Alkalihalobacterium sp. APHAB7]|uniref:GNAT family N-acetyltransferase n=1 Tax=Alkalihalobacterium sp. APHAB7 TaxID=3402081 RepID=UPI003AAEE145
MFPIFETKRLVLREITKEDAAAIYANFSNEASNQLLRKFGFENEGILRDYMYQSGAPHDAYVYSILKRNR